MWRRRSWASSCCARRSTRACDTRVIYAPCRVDTSHPLRSRQRGRRSLPRGVPATECVGAAAGARALRKRGGNVLAELAAGRGVEDERDRRVGIDRAGAIDAPGIEPAPALAAADAGAQGAVRLDEPNMRDGDRLARSRIDQETR